MKKLLTFITLMFSLASFAGSVAPWDEPLVVKSITIDPTMYYWFDASTGDYLYRQSTIDDEMWLTEFNEGTYNPKTLREYGYAPVDVWVDEYGYPTPIWNPTKILYSHP